MSSGREEINVPMLRACFMIECSWQMESCSVFVIVLMWSILCKLFYWFQHIYLNVKTLVGGSYICAVNDFLLSQEKAINMWVIVVSNAKNRCGLGNTDGKEGFSFMLFLAFFGVFNLSTNWCYLWVIGLSCKKMICCSIPNMFVWPPTFHCPLL